MSTVTTADGKTSISSPYHPDWPSAARALSGRWGEGVWVFDSRDEERVRALARKIYDTDGSPDPGSTVSVRIDVDNVQGERGGQPARLYEFGRLIATRFGRDEEPRLADSVILIEGGFEDSAGSHNYISSALWTAPSSRSVTFPEPSLWPGGLRSSARTAQTARPCVPSARGSSLASLRSTPSSGEGLRSAAFCGGWVVVPTCRTR
ncbi:MAG: hypothetical protein ACJ736_25520 [Streptomyces sp.]